MDSKLMYTIHAAYGARGAVRFEAALQKGLSVWSLAREMTDHSGPAKGARAE